MVQPEEALGEVRDRNRPSQYQLAYRRSNFDATLVDCTWQRSWPALVDFLNDLVKRIRAWNVLHRCAMPRVPQGRSVALLAALLAVSCASPTLPLPPPEAPTQTEGVDAAHVHLAAGCGGAQDGALIVIVNKNVAPDMAVGGAIATACGSWDSSVLAQSGDELLITQTSDDMASPPTTYFVR
jgi:hypothetical protein